MRKVLFSYVATNRLEGGGGVNRSRKFRKIFDVMYY